MKSLIILIALISTLTLMSDVRKQYKHVKWQYENLVKKRQTGVENPKLERRIKRAQQRMDRLRGALEAEKKEKTSSNVQSNALSQRAVGNKSNTIKPELSEPAQEWKEKVARSNQLGKLFIEDMKRYIKYLNKLSNRKVRNKGSALINVGKYTEYPEVKFIIDDWNKSWSYSSMDESTISRSIDRLKNIVKNDAIQVKFKYPEVADEIQNSIKENEKLSTQIDSLKNYIKSTTAYQKKILKKRKKNREKSKKNQKVIIIRKRR